MYDMMNGGTMLGMGMLWLLVVVLVLLGVAALFKYLFFTPVDETGPLGGAQGQSHPVGPGRMHGAVVAMV